MQKLFAFLISPLPGFRSDYERRSLRDVITLGQIWACDFRPTLVQCKQRKIALVVESAAFYRHMDTCSSSQDMALVHNRTDLAENVLGRVIFQFWSRYFYCGGILPLETVGSLGGRAKLLHMPTLHGHVTQTDQYFRSGHSRRWGACDNVHSSALTYINDTVDY